MRDVIVLALCVIEITGGPGRKNELYPHLIYSAATRGRSASDS
jgi:hypothetical protein